MARAIFQKFAERLASYSARLDKSYPVDEKVRLVSVRVWETASSWAEYYLL
jgi:6-pyruvoyltetrahydropterin/6-carboxytetrahydropterin synthase